MSLKIFSSHPDCEGSGRPNDLYLAHRAETKTLPLKIIRWLCPLRSRRLDGKYTLNPPTYGPVGLTSLLGSFPKIFDPVAGSHLYPVDCADLHAVPIARALLTRWACATTALHIHRASARPKKVGTEPCTCQGQEGKTALSCRAARTTAQAPAQSIACSSLH